MFEPNTSLTFEQFMARALHDPSCGYYARQIRRVGRGGDFTTAPMLSTAPARAIAAWATDAMRETQCRNLIELGPGAGTLAANVLQHLPWHVRLRTHLHLVETSAPLAAQQKKLLGKRASWHTTPLQALTACNGNAVIFSNELVDAFPVRRFQKNLTGWQELKIHYDANLRVHESLLDEAPLPDSSVFLAKHALGQWVEVHESYHHYLSKWLPSWKVGRMLTIDYGARADDLYQRQPNGSIRAYLLQQRIDGSQIYQNPGRQDITADVNFTDLENWSLPWVSENKLSYLRDFLQGYADDSLTDPCGAGTAFLVLDQKR